MASSQSGKVPGGMMTKVNDAINDAIPDSKIRGANMGLIWGRQGPGGPHVGPMNFAIRDMAL